ncbi:MAG: hypothetical protein QOH93_2674 [Chloroflexia bacterium]|jgi:uncharacterized protein (DUF433 family)|nr:hypothetical protein [Chloroflexia bacterium]
MYVTIREPIGLYPDIVLKVIMENVTALLPLEHNVVSVPLKEAKDGTLRVLGTRLTFDAIVEAFERGLTPDEIVRQYPSLSLANVYLLIGYYLHHHDEIEKYLQKRRQEVEADSRKVESTIISSTPELLKLIKDAKPVARRHEFERVVRAWGDYVRARRNLEAASFARSHKAAEAELAEWMVQFALGGELASSRSNPGFDVVAGDMRIEVKSISKADNNKNGYKVRDKDIKNDPVTGATHYAFLFYNDFIPDALFLVPTHFVQRYRGGQIKRADLEKEPGSRVDIEFAPFSEAVTL